MEKQTKSKFAEVTLREIKLASLLHLRRTSDLLERTSIPRRICLFLRKNIEKTISSTRQGRNSIMISPSRVLNLWYRFNTYKNRSLTVCLLILQMKGQKTPSCCCHGKFPRRLLAFGFQHATIMIVTLFRKLNVILAHYWEIKPLKRLILQARQL